MNKVVLLSLLSVCGMSFFGMDGAGGFVAPGELVNFLASPAAADQTLEKLKEKWAGEYLRDFGAYHKDNITVLHKFSALDNPSSEVIDFLLDDCQADPEFGAVGNTPRDCAKKKHKDEDELLVKFNRATFVKLFERWVNKDVHVLVIRLLII